MTYQSLQKIEDAYLEPENELLTSKKRRIKNKNQAMKRFNKRQQQLFEIITNVTNKQRIHIINGICYNTFEEAVWELGLLDKEDNEFNECLKEAATYQMPSQLWWLYAFILLFCDPKEFNAYKLFLEYIDDLNDDYLNQQKELRGVDDNANLSDYDISITITKTLIEIEKFLIPYNKTLEEFKLPKPNYLLIEDFHQTNLIMEESNYTQDKLKVILTDEDKLNEDQKKIYEIILKYLIMKLIRKYFLLMILKIMKKHFY